MLATTTTCVTSNLPGPITSTMVYQRIHNCSHCGYPDVCPLTICFRFVSKQAIVLNGDIFLVQDPAENWHILFIMEFCGTFQGKVDLQYHLIMNIPSYLMDFETVSDGNKSFQKNNFRTVKQITGYYEKTIMWLIIFNLSYTFLYHHTN